MEPSLAAVVVAFQVIVLVPWFQMPPSGFTVPPSATGVPELTTVTPAGMVSTTWTSCADDRFAPVPAATTRV